MVQLFKPHVLDIEASGFGEHSYPIEVGYCLSSGEKYCALIQPLKDWQHWDAHAEALHGITKAAILEVGLSVKAVAGALNSKLAGMTLYSDAWAQDKPWLDLIHDAARLPATYTLRAIEHIQSECQYLCWDQVRQEVMSSSTTQRHRASTDAELIQQVFEKTLLRCTQPKP